MTIPIRVLLLPGFFDSGPEHWQSYWERADPSCVRVVQQDWETPVRADWVATPRTARGPLLVAPSDTEASSFPGGPTGWQPMPLARLFFPSIVVASSGDEYVTLDRARAFAEAWGSCFVQIGAAGHINAASGLGAWSRGRDLLSALLREPTLCADEACDR
jgi:predicted alpha/beta hydrolase family esterase